MKLRDRGSLPQVETRSDLASPSFLALAPPASQHEDRPWKSMFLAWSCRSKQTPSWRLGDADDLEYDWIGGEGWESGLATDEMKRWPQSAGHHSELVAKGESLATCRTPHHCRFVLQERS